MPPLMRNFCPAHAPLPKELVNMCISDVSSLSLGLPAHPSEGNFARPVPAQRPKNWGSHMSEANLALPKPAQSWNLKKRQARARPKPENLRLAHQ